MRLLLLDAADAVGGRRNDLVPPRSAIESIGGLNFVEIGRELAQTAITFGRISPSSRVLDVGCGYGRVAVPLLDHLVDGRYDGFDISKGAIRWCQDHITARNARFRFLHADVRNRHYNARGHIEAEQFSFPYADNSMDHVFAASLFTHLMPGATRRYVEESARVLSTGGRFVASFFLLNAESRAAALARRGEPKFEVIDGDVAYQHASDPEAAVAISESSVQGVLNEAGLDIEGVQYGTWCERPNGTGYQDFVVAVKSRT
ncbi:MAG TPA: class I SAM-dependent methyltransferase [Thermoanaerobaculia bacterium]